LRGDFKEGVHFLVFACPIFANNNIYVCKPYPATVGEAIGGPKMDKWLFEVITA